MSNAKPFTAEDLDAMRQELTASDSNYLRADQMDTRWIATIDALSARVAKLEALLSDIRDNATSDIPRDIMDRIDAALEGKS